MKCLVTRFSMLLGSLGLVGCQILSDDGAIAAKIPVHSQESLVELRQSVNALFNGRDVLIAASAFNDSGRLIIQRKPIRDPAGRVIDTRIDEEPITLRLYLQNGDCYIKRDDKPDSIRLYRANCVPI